MKYFLVATVCLTNEFFYIYLHTQVQTFRSAKVTTRIFQNMSHQKGSKFRQLMAFSLTVGK